MCTLLLILLVSIYRRETDVLVTM